MNETKCRLLLADESFGYGMVAWQYETGWADLERALPDVTDLDLAWMLTLLQDQRALLSWWSKAKVSRFRLRARAVLRAVPWPWRRRERRDSWELGWAQETYAVLKRELVGLTVSDMARLGSWTDAALLSVEAEARRRWPPDPAILRDVAGWLGPDRLVEVARSPERHLAMSATGRYIFDMVFMPPASGEETELLLLPFAGPSTIAEPVTELSLEEAEVLGLLPAERARQLRARFCQFTRQEVEALGFRIEGDGKRLGGVTT
jgi:hypothetical protein